MQGADHSFHIQRQLGSHGKDTDAEEFDLLVEGFGITDDLVDPLFFRGEGLVVEAAVAGRGGRRGRVGRVRIIGLIG